jgi:transposase
MTDAALEAALFAAAGTKQGHRRHAEPDWAEIHRELKRKHVTLAMLWDEYIERHPEGYRYSRFCELYRVWASRLSVTMRQAHAGGDKLFVDYAGDTVPVIVDRLTGQVRAAQIFVAVLGASNFTPAFAGAGSTPRRAGPRRWPTGSALIPELLPRSAVCRNCWCRTTPRACPRESGGRGHQGLPLRAAGQSHRRRNGGALRYRDPPGAAPSATRQGESRSRGAGIERWLLGRLRHHRFYSLAELNAAIGELLRQLNDERPIRRLGVTRRALFEELDRPNLNALPAEPDSFAEWRLRRVGVDYHVEIEGHFYSVPYRFARSEVEVRLTPRAVEIFLRGERIAAHLRASGNRRHTTVPEHMPSSHRRYADWTVERIRCQAAAIGPATAALCELILERRPHPEQGFRACLGIVRLVRPFGAARLEAAAMRAIEIGTLTYGSVRSILDNKLDRQTSQPPPANGAPLLHPNIRGPRYYH